MTAQIFKEAYFAYALAHLVIDMDVRGTFAKVPSEKNHNVFYRVDIDESRAADVHADDCSCPTHRRRKTYCKHEQVLDMFFARLMAPYNNAVDAVAAENDKNKLDAFYEIRGAQAAANLAALKSIDTPCSLNGTRVSSEVSVKATSIEAGLASRHLLR
jgi:hypothetical protein